MHCSVIFLLVFVCFCGIPSLAIYDENDHVTKPPKRRENLPWPRRSYHGEVNTKTGEHKYHNVRLSTEYTFQGTPTKPSESYSRTQTSWTQTRPNIITDHTNFDRPNKWENYEKNSDSLCEPKSTGQFVYLPDCRRFINCYKGRGYVQVCAPGTLFNPETLECDFPAKVRCLVSPAEYKVNPVYPNEDDFDVVDEPPASIAPATNRHPFNRGFKSYKVTPPTTGYLGVQPGYNPFYKPEQPVPSEEESKTKSGPRQYFNVGSPFNIQPTYNDKNPNLQSPDSAVPFGGSSSSQHYQPGYVNTYGSPNPGYYINTGIYQGVQPPSNPQNQSQYPGFTSNQKQPTQHGYYSKSVNSQGQPGNYPSGVPQHSQSGYVVGSYPGAPGQPHSIYPTISQGSPNQKPGNIYPQGNTQPVQPPVSQPSYGPFYTDQPSYVQPQSGQPYYIPSQSGQPSYIPPQSGQPSYIPPQVGQPQYIPSQNGQPQYIPSQNGQPQYIPSPNGQPSQSHPSYIPSQGGQPSYVDSQSGRPYYGPLQGRQPSYSPPQNGQPSYTPFQNGQSSNVQPNSFPNPANIYPPTPKVTTGYQSPNHNYFPEANSTTRQNPGPRKHKQLKCPEGASGLYKHPSNCYKFLQCDHGRTFIMDCGPGTAFNPNLSVCDYPYNVDCSDTQNEEIDHNVDENVDESQFIPEWTHNNDTGFISKNNKTIPDSELASRDESNIKCPKYYYGLYQHPWNCFKYLLCTVREVNILECGKGNAFNTKTLICDCAYNVDCTGREFDKSSYTPSSDEGLYNSDCPGPEFEKNHKNPKDTDWTYNSGYSESEAHLVDQIDVRMPPPPQSFPSSTTKTYHIKPATSPAPVSHSQRVPGVKEYSTTVQPNSTSEILGEIPLSSDRTDIKVEELDFIPKRTPVGRTNKKILTPVKTPRNRQIARLRGGVKPSEGFLELYTPETGWGVVCDKPNSWTIEEANIVCKQLGYDRGAELTWQGLPNEGQILNFKPVSYDIVTCTGNEVSIMDCNTANTKNCNPEQHGVWVRCYNNRQSHCMPGEFSYNGQCYLLVIPKEEGDLESVGFSQGEALAHCQSRSGHLLDITSQEENDFISEWLIHLGTNMTPSSVMTSGVGVSVLGRPLWIWEGSEDSFEYNNWWPGWLSGRAYAPRTQSTRALCVVARRYFPCPNSGLKVSEAQHLCDAEYFFWDAEDCAAMSNKHPYVCERKADDIGCIVGNGLDYKGKANVTFSSTACLPWDSPLVTPALKYRVSDVTFKATLAGHNYCRNFAASDQEPWCFVRTQTGIKKETCDIPACKIETTPLEKSGGEAYTCGPNLFACELNNCIPTAWLCDGSADCKNGYDELNCTTGLDKFTKHESAQLSVKHIEKWLHTSAANCASHCLEAKDYICRSFAHSSKDQVCLLSDTNIGLSGSLNVSVPHWDYYEMNSRSVQCNDMFVCGNGKCINKNMTCNGKNDCGDRSDERNCSAANLGYEIRLSGGNNSNEGYIEVKILGEWGVICDDQFDMRDAEVACRELGFTLGAVEIRPHSAYKSVKKGNPLYLVDDLQCRGNETTIRDCEFNGWGVHDCGEDEIVGVVCKVPGLMCATNFWQCEETKECIPVAYLCDNIPDCDDGSDEEPTRCKSPIEVRLVGRDRSGSPTEGAGRVEVRRYGIWGTICDDDFGTAEATVICNHLGFPGKGHARKEGAFGEGTGIIWLDQLRCSGNESNLDECFHQQWGQHDCQHQEDVAVMCSQENVPVPTEPTVTGVERRGGEEIEDPYNIVTADNILPKECGIVADNLHLLDKDFTPKVVKGQEVFRGTHPWQASIRVRTMTKSVHWCGAVIISPLHILTSAHCLMDYTKSAYFVRTGDFDTELLEESEQEADIEAIYVHEDYNKDIRLNNDLALIKLKGLGLKFNAWVRPACLPTKYTKYHPGTNCTISGWGSNGQTGSGYARRLRAAKVPILSIEECKAPYVYGESLSGGMFCAGDLKGGVDSCQGDSGGPLICSNQGRSTLYGITSWGLGCGRANKPGVYTKVNLYLDWIHMKLHDSLNGRR